MVNETIKRLEFWNHLTEEQQRLLLLGAIVKVVSKENVLFHEGEKGNRIGILASGKLHFVQPVAGRSDAILHVAYPGEMFGETLLTHPGIYEYRVETVEESTVVLIRLPDFLHILQQNPMVSWCFFYALVKRMRKAETRLIDIHYHTVEHRLRGVLRELMVKEGRSLLNGEVEITERLPHKLIAKLCVSTREYVSVVLNDLREQGIIKYDRWRMIIRRPDLL